MSRFQVHRAAALGDVALTAALLDKSGKPIRDLQRFDEAAVTPLMCAASSAKAGVEMLELLLARGSDLHQQSSSEFVGGRTALSLAAAHGDLRKVKFLVEAGSDVQHVSTSGYSIVLEAVHSRQPAGAGGLLDLLAYLISCNAPLSSISSYSESALRVLARTGRFDAVNLLLEAGADFAQLEWTPLMRVVALGTLDGVNAELADSPMLEAKDFWEKTAWLLAVQTGDLQKAELLRQSGADTNATGRCEQTALLLAVQGDQIPMLRWLLDAGFDVEQTDQFGNTPLHTAIESGNAAAFDLLSAAGADVLRQKDDRSLLCDATHQAIATRLLASGCDPLDLSFEARRTLVGLPAEQDRELKGISKEAFLSGQFRRFGKHNPEDMTNPCWVELVRSGLSAYLAADIYDASSGTKQAPGWSAQRFGQSITFLPDGRVVQIGGEHEDHYDLDFCIYNDVFVHAPDGSMRIYGYPETSFQPTDFHTATLAGDFIFVIGCLGYQPARSPGVTPVYRLDTRTFCMERIVTSGDAPGWLWNHLALLKGQHEIQVSGGTVLSVLDGENVKTPNINSYILILQTMEWRIGAT